MLESIDRFISSFNLKYIKPWFFSNNDPDRIKAPYVISFVFLSLTISAIIIHLTIKIWQFYEITKLWRGAGVDSLPQIETLAKVDMSLIPLISILIGTAGMFIGLYNWGKTGKDGIKKDSDGSVGGVSPSGDGVIRNSEV
jgi:hypothetical protein